MMYVCKHRNKDGKPCPESKNGTCSYGIPRYCSSTTKPENAKKFLGFPIINIPEYIGWWLSPVKSFFRSLIRSLVNIWKSRKGKS